MEIKKCFDNFLWWNRLWFYVIWGLPAETCCFLRLKMNYHIMLNYDTLLTVLTTDRLGVVISGNLTTGFVGLWVMLGVLWLMSGSFVFANELVPVVFLLLRLAVTGLITSGFSDFLPTVNVFFFTAILSNVLFSFALFLLSLSVGV